MGKGRFMQQMKRGARRNSRRNYARFLPATLFVLTAVVLVIVLLNVNFLPTSSLSRESAQVEQSITGGSQQSPSGQSEAARGESRELLGKSAQKTPDAKDGAGTVAIDWEKPSGTQPDLSKYGSLSVDVDLKEQRATVKSGATTIYAMLISSGMHDSTPRGNFTIGTRGSSFFNANENMGAKWWTAFSGTTFLFHSVPTDANGSFIKSEGAKLGKPASHGCIRLSVADAQWFYQQVPSGTPVAIH